MTLPVADAASPASHRAVAFLLECGWLSDDEARRTSLRVDTAVSSHELHRVRVGPRAVVVKFARSGAGAHTRTLEAELCAYRLARWIPEIAAVLPPAVAMDERRQVLAMDDLSPAEGPWPPANGLQPPIGPAQAAELGAAMAGWQRATLELPMRPSPACGILGLAADPAFAGQDRPASTRLLMLKMAADPAISCALDRAAKRFQPTCLTHGDLRRENLMSDAAGRLRVIDWDLSGAGDPAWDLASAVALEVLEPARRVLAAGGRPDPWPPEARTRVAALLGAYAGAQGPLDLDAAGSREHLLDCVMARLLHIACEWSDWDEAESHSVALMQLAREAPEAARADPSFLAAA